MVAKKRSDLKMIVSTLIMAVLAITLIGLGYSKGQNQHISGMRSAWDMLIQVMPLLIFAFIVAGMVQVLIPHELLSKWIGAESGWRGILIGTAAGGLSPGGPYVSLPIVAALLRSGASIGTVVAFLTGWSLWAIARLPMEIGILGWKFTLIRLTCTFFFPPVAGLLAQVIFGRWINKF